MAKIEIETFSSREAEQIACLSTTLQHEHRRRGHLPKEVGHPKHDLFQLLQFAFVADLAKFGIGPAAAYASAEWAAHSALHYSLEVEGVVEGSLASEYTIPEASQEELRNYTARRVFAEAFRRPRIAPNRWALFWGDGSEVFAPSVEIAMNQIPEQDSRFGAPFIAIDAKALAMRIAHRLPRAACKVVI